MSSQVCESRFAQLAEQVLSFKRNPPSRPVKSDYERLIAARNEIKGMREVNQNSRLQALIDAGTEIMRLEKLYKLNGNQWAL